MTTRPVTVGVDGSDAALKATRWAAAEASARHAPLKVVHGYHWPTHGQIEGVHLGGDVEAAVLEQTYAQVRAAAGVAREVAPDLDVTTAVSASGPVVALLAESRSAQLLVVGSRGLGGFAALLLGSTGIAVASQAKCPVAVIRGEPMTPAAAPILVGVDTNSPMENVLAVAFEFAATHELPLVALHCWGDLLVQDGFAFGGLMIDWDAMERGVAQDLADRLAAWQQKYPEVVVETRFARDTPASCLLDQARSASAVVVGTRGRGRVGGVVLGSTSHALIHHAPCPVVVVPPGEGSDDAVRG